MKGSFPRKSLGVVWVLSALLAIGASPADAYQQDLKKMASDLATRMHAVKHSRVTVVDFVDLDGKPTKLGRFLAQQFQLSLAEPELRLTVVDQSQLSQLLDQVEMLHQGLLDPTTGREIGQMTGTEVIVLGTVMSASLTVRIDIKAIDLQTAKMITGGSTNLVRTGILSKLANDSQEAEEETASAGTTQAVAQSAKAKAPQGPARTRRDQGMIFDMEGCSLSSDEITCVVTATSDDRDRWLSVTFDSRAWNETGDEFGPDEITIANSRSSRSCAAKQVLKDVPTRLSLRFPNFGEAEIVERLRLYWAEANDCCCYTSRPVNFEKIALSEDIDFGSPRATAHTGKGKKDTTGEQGKQAGGGLKKLGGRLLDAVGTAAEKIIDKETREITGEDEESEEPPHD